MTIFNEQSKKLNFILLLVPLVLLVLIGSGCNAPTQVPTQPPATEPVQTEVKEVPDSPLPPTTTPLPELPPATPSPTASPSPTFTSTPAPYVMVAGNTNCRFGPGSVYDLLYTYLSGDQAKLLGISPDGNFWYTSDENGIIPDCWLWGNYATPVGDVSLLPIFTPPPTPTPSPNFVVSYENSDCAAGSCWLWFKIDNTGSVAWESVLVFAENIVTSDTSVNVSNVFKATIAGSNINKIQPGASAYTHSERLPNPSGNTVEVIVIACEKDGLTEICQGRTLTVNP